MRYLLATAMGCAILLISTASDARADLVVTMTGEIAEGALNGSSLNGQSFQLNLDISTGEDLATANLRMGIFAASSGEITFSSGASYQFEANQIYLGQSDDGNLMTIGILDQPDVDQPINQLGYASSSIDPLFDPNRVSTFEITNFDNAFARGAGDIGPATYVNGGDTLEVGALSLNGASFSAVPEPSSAPLLIVVAAASWYWHCRRK